jgi:hypothetical protein
VTTNAYGQKSWLRHLNRWVLACEPTNLESSNDQVDHFPHGWTVQSFTMFPLLRVCFLSHHSHHAPSLLFPTNLYGHGVSSSRTSPQLAAVGHPSPLWNLFPHPPRCTTAVASETRSTTHSISCQSCSTTSTAHQIEREYRVLDALKHNIKPDTLLEKRVPVPQPYTLCEYSAIIGTPFYLMEFLDGRIFTDVYTPQLAVEWARCANKHPGSCDL